MLGLFWALSSTFLRTPWPLRSADVFAAGPPAICADIGDASHCQDDPGVMGVLYISDESVGASDPAGTSRVADDFVALENGAIDMVCLIGAYASFDDGHDCAGELPPNSDNFVVSVYEGDPAANYALPGLLKGSRTTILVAKELEFTDGGFDFFRYELELSSPIPGIIAGNIYWIEIHNDTTADPQTCNWLWLSAADGEGNRYLLHDISDNYGPEDISAGDLAFCLNLTNEPPPEPIRACCTCQGSGVAGEPPSCSDATFFECNVQQKQRWVFDVLECAAAGDTCEPVVDAPDNDECTGAFPLASGLNRGLTNRCATNSAGELDVVDCDGVNIPFDNDVWYTYIDANCDGPIMFDTCDAQNGSENLLMAVYGGNDPTCPCPATVADTAGCNDDGCFWPATGSQLTFPSAAGHCFLIRLAGFSDGDGAEWEDISLRISCILIEPGDSPIAGDNTCQIAGADTGIPCSTDADCTEPAECGLKSRYISITPANPTFVTSIRVRVLTAPQFPGIVGHVFYAGPEQSIPNSPNPAQRGAPLVCVGAGTPHSQIWTTGPLHLFGASIVPTTNTSGITSYAVAHCDVNGDNCGFELQVEMAKWGDVARPFTGGSQPNFGDVSSIVAKFGNLASAPSMPRADIVGVGNPGNPNTPNQVANFSDVSNDVSAFSGFPYPFTVLSCPP